MYRTVDKDLEVLLVHPGGPFWKNKDEGAWSLPKGEFSDDEDPLDAAKREFEEETGFRPSGQFIPLPHVKLRSGKTVYAWALENDIAADKIKSNEFEMEWPPKSGKKKHFPEVDKAGWFKPAVARKKINTAQVAFIDALIALLKM